MAHPREQVPNGWSNPPRSKHPTWSGQGSMVTGTPPTDTIWAVGRADQVAELDAAVQYATIVGVGLILDYIQMNAVKTTQAAYNGNAKDPGGKFMQYALAWRSKVSGLSGVTTPEIFWQRIEVEGADAKSYFYRAQSHTALSGKDYRAYMRGALEGIKANAQDAKDVAAADAAEQAMKEIPE